MKPLDNETAEMSAEQLNELERILTQEKEIQPMTGFSTRVLRAIREETAAPPPIAFPWSRFLPGFVLNVVLLLGATVWMLLQPGSLSTTPIPTEWLADPQTRGLLLAALTTLGTGALTWTTLKWIAPRSAGTF